MDGFSRSGRNERERERVKERKRGVATEQGSRYDYYYIIVILSLYYYYIIIVRSEEGRK